MLVLFLLCVDVESMYQWSHWLIPLLSTIYNERNCYFLQERCDMGSISFYVYNSIKFPQIF